MKYSNSQIRDFLNLIEGKSEYYASSSDKALVRGYDECDDFIVGNDLIESIWALLKSKFYQLESFTEDAQSVTILHTNSGTGRILEPAVKNVLITAYNNDYTCKRISDLLNQANGIDYDYISEIFDISHFFIGGNNNNTKKYDVVFTQPSESDDYYKGIDGTDMSKLSSVEYYSVRSLDFVTKGGYLCVLVSPSTFNIVKNNKYISSQTEVVSEYSPNGDDKCGYLILKKK